MNPFSWMTSQIHFKPDWAHVSLDAFEEFEREYIFDALRDTTFGQAFCQRFNIEDDILSKLPSTEFARDRILRIYINHED